ncbi:MAG TPA: hypothetical protein EYH40_01755 [Desulfurococcales archaeon]|nr:hypothetical protein [Desulfurococcales archaeon]
MVKGYIIDSIIKSIISKRDPQGYYVIPLRNKPELNSLLSRFKGLNVESYGSIVIVRTKSRDIAKRIIRDALRCGLVDST